jgi:hypothetical protein
MHESFAVLGNMRLKLERGRDLARGARWRMRTSGQESGGVLKQE